MGGFIKTDEIDSQWAYRQMLRMVKDGELVRVRQGIYALPEVLGSLMYDMEKIIPGGIICSYSAWAYYNLTTQTPYGVFVALPRGRKARVPGFPVINISYVSSDLFHLGEIESMIGGYKCHIYDLERSVCDAIKARNKIGIDVCAEILNNYLQRKDKNLVLLNKYAKILRIQSTLNKYLEISL